MYVWENEEPQDLAAEKTTLEKAPRRLKKNKKESCETKSSRSQQREKRRGGQKERGSVEKEGVVEKRRSTESLLSGCDWFHVILRYYNDDSLIAIQSLR